VPLMSQKHPDDREAPGISSADFPALRDFLRGYFHEDVVHEYGSAEAAARQFCEDADAQQRKAVVQDGVRLLDKMKKDPWAATNAALTSKLGSAYSFESLSEFERILVVVRECGRQN
jgi:hypothetical protein